MPNRRTVLSAIASGLAAAVIKPASAFAAPAQPAKKTYLYANIGPRLMQFEVDAEAMTLTQVGAIQLPDSVQYVWPHQSRRYLYVATSNTQPGNGAAAGNSHHLVAIKVGRTGGLSLHGAALPLPSRPIHLSTDIPSANALVAFSKPSALRVYAINEDGTLKGEVAQHAPIDAGIYAHQARVAPSNELAILVTRGNEGTPDHAEEPGALKVFRYADGQLSSEYSVTRDQGRGFGPRHVDFHPTRPWVYLSIETQNQVSLLRIDNGRVEPDFLFTRTTLDPKQEHRARQAAGPIHVHPNGRFLYCANRAEQTEDVQGTAVFKGGENSIAVYVIDPQTGQPTLKQHIDTHGIHPRTFHIDPSGRMLVAEHNLPVVVRRGNALETVSAGLSVFRIDADGTLAFIRKYDFDVGGQSMFWCGMVEGWG
ncbi:lactonase family protein [Pseudomonas sp. KNUC1026]|uniref:lactonase family protein n=1 Tax=Pseudomonas sp. KNUC1026 TaxID=2893890 RepID=UPI001F33B993|nr:beta-propeller fold lactonase family protein [Pseudomonas sp. KNUC1026]UFH50458.1 lactonase family protein [Pseudomonas sp. KNUC1026]